MAKIKNHVENTVDNLRDSAGGTHEINAAYLDGKGAEKYVTTDTAQTITGRKTFNSPANVNSQEVATAIFKTSNGGRLIIGKEGPNSGTMLRFDQTAGTTRLQFRASATPGAMVWSQPEKGAKLYFDLTNSAGVSTRTTLDARSGTIARAGDIGNGTITIKKNGTSVGSFTTNQSDNKDINLALTKNDVGLGNVDNTADQNKSVNYASGAGKIVSQDKNSSFSYENLLLLSNHAKVYYIDTSKTPSVSQQLYYNSQFKSDKDTISITMTPNSAISPSSRGIYDDNVGLVGSEDLKMGDIIITNNYPPRYISKKVWSNTAWNIEFTIIKNPSNGMLKITGSSGFEDTNWHYRKIGHFIFNNSDDRNGAPVHISGVIGSWAQAKMIFDIFVSTRGNLKVNGFVRGTNPSCRLVIDNTANPNIFLAIKGFATYNITVDTFENAQNENNAVRGSFHIDWTGGDDFSGPDVGVTATNFGYKDLLSRAASQRAYYAHTGPFSETSGELRQICSVSGGETGKIICVHAKSTSANSELSIQRKTSPYHDYDCIAVAPTGYSSGTYISCTGVVPPSLQYSIATDYSEESTYYIFGRSVSEVYVITFDLP